MDDQLLSGAAARDWRGTRRRASHGSSGSSGDERAGGSGMQMGRTPSSATSATTPGVSAGAVLARFRESSARSTGSRGSQTPMKDGRQPSNLADMSNALVANGSVSSHGSNADGGKAKQRRSSIARQLMKRVSGRGQKLLGPSADGFPKQGNGNEEQGSVASSQSWMAQQLSKVVQSRAQAASKEVYAMQVTFSALLLIILVLGIVGIVTQRIIGKELQKGSRYLYATSETAMEFQAFYNEYRFLGAHNAITFPPTL